MIKATEKDTERKEAVLNVSPADIKRNLAYLHFPVNAESKKAIRELATFEADIKNAEDNLHYLATEASRYEKIRTTARLAQFKAKKSITPETMASEEEVEAVLKRVARMPWVEKLELTGTRLIVYTRKDSLKTVLDERMVALGEGGRAIEFMEPQEVSLPQYKLNIALTNLGEGGWSMNIETLAIALFNQEDIMYPDKEAGKLVRQRMDAHWASSGANGQFSAWENLCLGDSANDVQKASAKGLVELLSEIATYLQVSDDPNAFRRKYDWAAGLGKHGYEFIVRQAEAGETAQSIEKKHKADYKKYRQVEAKEEIDGRNVRASRAARRLTDAFAWTTITEPTLTPQNMHVFYDQIANELAPLVDNQAEEIILTEEPTRTTYQTLTDAVRDHVADDLYD